jgi:hypothetical protein
MLEGNAVAFGEKTPENNLYNSECIDMNTDQ